MKKKEIIIFSIVGSATVFVDFISYNFLVIFNIFTIDIAKGISFMLGLSFAYFANKYWTFSSNFQRKNPIFRFILLYMFSLLINIFVNSTVLKNTTNFIYSFEIAFLIATFFSASINFIGMKFFVFNDLKER